jgi:hypothetical protein
MSQAVWSARLAARDAVFVPALVGLVRRVDSTEPDPPPGLWGCCLAFDVALLLPGGLG